MTNKDGIWTTALAVCAEFDSGLFSLRFNSEIEVFPYAIALPHKGGGEGRNAILPSPFMGEEADARSAAAGEGSLQSRAKQMRLNPTEAERKIWYALRDNRFAGYKFRRQEPIGRYIADFVCYSPRIIVEVDGSQQIENTHDQLRDRWFESQGFIVLRFWNADVLSGLEGVLTAIGEAIKSHPAPGTPPGRGKSATTYDLGDKK